MNPETTTAADPLTAITVMRQAAVANGYRPIPIPTGEKGPRLPGWQNMRASGDDVAGWRQTHPDCGNTGIVCGNVVGVDIDVLDSRVADALEFAAMERFGISPLRRVGRAPKVLLVYRAGVDGMGKSVTPTLTLPNTELAPKDRIAKVEILATGQQFVAWGRHPDTGADYSWAGHTPATVPVDMLPVITPEQVRGFLAECEQIMREHGATGGAAKPASTARTAGPGKPAPGFEAPPSEAAVVDLLDNLPNPASVDRSTWAGIMTGAVACIVELGGDPEDPDSPIAAAVIAWAYRYENHDGTDERAKWVKDWSKRRDKKAGWQSLAKAARKLNPEYYRAVVAAAEFGPITDAEPAEAEQPASRRRSMRERFVFPGDCETARRGYVIKHLIAPGDVGCIIGQPSAGKSVLAPHLAYAVAQGRPVFGLRTKPGRVLYVAAEDFTGMRQRIQALRLQHGDAPEFAAVDCGNLRDPAEAADLRAAVRDWNPALVVIDTLGAAFAGLDENSAQDMGQVVKLARQVAATGCAVLLIHHVAKQGDGTPRGHSVLNGTLDVSLRLERDDGGIVRGRLGKNRNGTEDRDIAFRIGVAMLGTDDDGEPVTAPVARELTGQPQAAAQPKLSPSETAALDVLTELQPGAAGVAEDAWRAACEERRIAASDNPRNRRTVIAKLIAGLLQKGRIAIDGGTVRLAGTAPEFGPAEPDGTLAELVQ